jgi:hypothetical protein
MFDVHDFCTESLSAPAHFHFTLMALGRTHIPYTHGIDLAEQEGWSTYSPLAPVM